LDGVFNRLFYSSNIELCILPAFFAVLEMAHPYEHEVWPVGSVIRKIETGEFALIKEHIRHFDGKFQYYLVNIEGKDGQYAAIHDRYELEALPKKE
jgi:hypothetical protein